MGIGNRISLWINETTPFKEAIDWNRRMGERSRAFKNYITVNEVFSGVWTFVNLATVVFAYIGYVWFNVGFPNQYFIDRNDNVAIDGISREVGRLARQSATSPAAKETLEVMGALISDPFIGFLKSYAAKEEINADEFIRGFYGTLMAIPMIGGGISTMGEVLSGGQIDNLGKPITDAYFTLGLGFVGWQGVSPYLTEGALAPVTRGAKRTFRQTRFKVADALELYRYGRIELNEVVSIAQSEGWRDSDIDKVIFLARTHLNRSDILELLDQGKIDATQATIRLKKVGYSVEDATTIVAMHLNKKTETSKSISLASAKKALKLGIIDELQFTNYLKALNYDSAAIQLEISIINFDREVEEKELSIGQLRTAYMNNVITVQEVKTALNELDYTDASINTLIATWQKQKAPKILRLNKGSILQALTKGVISSDVAMTKLLTLNYSQEDARIAIETVTVQTNVNIKQISDAKILEAYQTKIITRSDALSRLLARKYSQADAELLLTLSETTNKIELSEDDILDAYLFGALDRNQAISQLTALGASQSFIDTRLATMDKRRTNTKRVPSAGDISTWLRGGLIDESKARLKLQEIGFNQEDSELFVRSVSIAPNRELSDGNIVDALTVGVIDAAKALSLFRGIGLNELDAQLRVDTVAKQREIFRPKASASTLVSATRDGIISGEELEEKLRGLNFDDQNIQLYLQLASYENPTQEIKLSKADILKAYRKGFMGEAEALALLEKKGYSLEESALLLAMEQRDIIVTETYQLLADGVLSPDEAIDLWSSEGFSSEDIEGALESLGFEV